MAKVNAENLVAYMGQRPLGQGRHDHGAQAGGMLPQHSAQIATEGKGERGVENLNHEDLVCENAEKGFDKSFDEMPDDEAGAMIVFELPRSPFVAIGELASRPRLRVLPERSSTLLKGRL